MKNQKKKALIIVMVLVLAIPTTVYAATTIPRASNIKSKGVVKYTNGTNEIVIDSADLMYLANEIDALESTYKTSIASAINKLDKDNRVKDVSATDASGNYRPYSELMEEIQKTQATAAAPTSEQLLSGKEVWANGHKITGTMVNNGATGVSNLAAGKSYTIPAGYTTGGTVTTANLASQTKGTATAANLSAGVTAWVNGTKITGTGADNNAYYAMGKQETRLGFVSQGDVNQVIELKPGNYAFYYHGRNDFWHKIVITLSDGTTVENIDTADLGGAWDKWFTFQRSCTFTVAEGQTLTVDVMSYCGTCLFVIMPVD